MSADGRGPALGAEQLDDLLAGVEAADAEVARAWPGPDDARQPVQVLYVPVDQVRADTATAAGAEALRLLRDHAPDGRGLAGACGLELDDELADRVHARVVAKLTHEPVEDLRADAEDGYDPGGPHARDPDEERAHVTAAAAGMAHGVVDGWAPPFLGLRVRSFADGQARRSVDLLDRYLGTFLDVLAGGGVHDLPPGFTITLPKIVAVAHVEAFVRVLAALEATHGLPVGSLRFEAQVETPASVIGPDGEPVLRALRDAADGRLRSVHIGVYDHSAALGLPPSAQRLDHPALDWLRHLVQHTFAGTEVRLSDGSSAVRPADGSTEAVHAVWARHAADVRHSLRHGWGQGWDLHPSHLVSRYATVFADLLVDHDEVVARLAAWEAGEPYGGVLDEPATITALRRQHRRAVDAGAVAP